jgi:sporulation protein YlmC with PRC-barrel domain
MLRKVSSLFDYAIHTKDGEDMGKVHDLYFDRTDWTTRYLVVDIGAWLFGRRILISTSALGKPRWDEHGLPVNLTKAEVKESPDINLAAPVTRAQEAEIFRHYGWPSYWSTPMVMGSGVPLAAIGSAAYAPVDAGMPHEVIEALDNSEESEIYSAREVMNDTIEATDGTIGHVADFILDDEDWVIRYLLVDTGNWLPRKKVLLSPRWVESVDWNKSRVYVNVTREQVKHSPEYDPSQPIERSYERELHEHYGYPEYW